MTQSATITIRDKQLSGRKANSPYKVEAENGDIYKAWPDVGANLHVGETYHIAWENVPSRDPAYPPSATIKAATKSDSQSVGNGTGGGRPGPAVAPRLPIDTDWAEVDIRRHTATMFAADWPLKVATGNNDMVACLDECRAAWKAHLGRTKAPTVKPVTKSELIEEDWDEFTAT